MTIETLTDALAEIGYLREMLLAIHEHADDPAYVRVLAGDAIATVEVSLGAAKESGR